MKPADMDMGLMLAKCVPDSFAGLVVAFVAMATLGVVGIFAGVALLMSPFQPTAAKARSMAKGCLWCCAVLVPLAVVASVLADYRMMDLSFAELRDMGPALGLLVCPPLLALGAKGISGWTLRRRGRGEAPVVG